MKQLLLLFPFLFFMQDGVSAQENFAQKQLIIKLPTTNFLNLLRPSIPIALEYENGSKYSLQARYAYKPSSFGKYSLFPEKLNHRFSRGEVELRINQYWKRHRIYAGFQLFLSSERFEQEEYQYHTNSGGYIDYDYADILVIRNGGMLNLGWEFCRHKKVSYEFSIASGLHETVVSYEQVIPSPNQSSRNLPPIIPDFRVEGKRIGIAFRFDFNVIVPLKSWQNRSYIKNRKS